jgi:hypothetical protein
MENLTTLGQGREQDAAFDMSHLGLPESGMGMLV